MKRTLWTVIGIAALWSGAVAAQEQPAAQNPPTPAPAPAVQEAPKPAEPTGPAPKLQLSLEEWDFGQKWYGDDCETEITLENAGQGPLRIQNVRSSCGCTVAKPSSAASWNGLTLQPGQKEAVKLTYNTKKVKAQVAQTVTIESNDPARPQVEIKIKGSIMQLFDITPTARVVFANVEKDTVESKELGLKSNVAEPVELAIEPLAEGNVRFDAKLETVEAGKSYKLIVATKPPLDNGANNAMITLKTNHSKYPTIQVPVSAFVAPRVTVSPRRLFIPRNATTKTERFVRVRYKTSEPMAVTEVVSSNPAVVMAELVPPKTEVNPKATIAMHEIRITLPPANELPAEGATVTIKTNDKSAEYQEFKVQIGLQPTPPAAQQGLPTRDGGGEGGNEMTPVKPADAPSEKPADAPGHDHDHP